MEQTSAKPFTNHLFYAILLWQCNKNLKKSKDAIFIHKAENGFICYKRLLL